MARNPISPGLTSGGPLRCHSAPDAADCEAAGAARAAHESRAALKREHAVRNGRARGAWLTACSAPQPVRAHALGLDLFFPESPTSPDAAAAAAAAGATASPPAHAPALSRSAPGALSSLAEEAGSAAGAARRAVRPVHQLAPLAAAPAKPRAGHRASPAPRPPARRTQGWLPTIHSVSEAGSGPCDEAGGPAGVRAAFAMPPAPQVAA